jgi:hypothetical protein
MAPRYISPHSTSPATSRPLSRTLPASERCAGNRLTAAEVCSIHYHPYRPRAQASVADDRVAAPVRKPARAR